VQHEPFVTAVTIQHRAVLFFSSSLSVAVRYLLALSVRAAQWPVAAVHLRMSVNPVILWENPVKGTLNRNHD